MDAGSNDGANETGGIGGRTMTAMLFVFVWLGFFIAIGGILEEVLPKRVWDKLFRFLHID